MYRNWLFFGFSCIPIFLAINFTSFLIVDLKKWLKNREKPDWTWLFCSPFFLVLALLLSYFILVPTLREEFIARAHENSFPEEWIESHAFIAKKTLLDLGKLQGSNSKLSSYIVSPAVVLLSKQEDKKTICHKVLWSRKLAELGIQANKPSDVGSVIYLTHAIEDIGTDWYVVSPGRWQIMRHHTILLAAIIDLHTSKIAAYKISKSTWEDSTNWVWNIYQESETWKENLDTIESWLGELRKR